MPRILDGHRVIDFLGQHMRSHWHSVLLVVLFLLSLLFTVLLTNALMGALWALLTHTPLSLHWHALSLPTVVFMSALILGGAGVEWYRLRKGGRAIARRLAARPIALSSAQPEERLLLRVVDHMALTAQVSAPVCFVMPNERGINAFVAGHQAQDMVLVLTQGALQTLDREELQGVVAHAFSHIFKGDTQINLRLMVAISGLLLLSQMGSWVMQRGQAGEPEPRRAAWLWQVLGALIWLLGSVGVVLGRLIKLLVLRDREFLADQSSVQYNRSMGVLRALLRVRAHSYGSKLQDIHAESISHFCFCSALLSDGWLSTHPPLDDRIGALDPASLRRVQARDRLEHSKVNTRHSMASIQAVVMWSEQLALEPPEWQPPQPWPRLREFDAPLRDEQHSPLAILLRFSTPRPDVIRRALLTGAGCRELLAAIIVMRQGTRVDPELHKISRALSTALLGMDVRLYLAIYQEALLGLGDLPESAARQLLHRLALLMQADGCIGLVDSLLLEWLKSYVNVRTLSLPLSKQDCTADLCLFADALLASSGVDRSQQVVLREQLLCKILNTHQVSLPTYTNITVDLGLMLNRLSGLPRHERLNLLQITEAYLWTNLRMTQEECDLMALLYWRFGLQTVVLPIEKNDEGEWQKRLDIQCLT